MVGFLFLRPLETIKLVSMLIIKTFVITIGLSFVIGQGDFVLMVIELNVTTKLSIIRFALRFCACFEKCDVTKPNQHAVDDTLTLFR
jgi:hypothetical protein